MAKPQWLSDLEKNGYAVVPGVIPQSSCNEFKESALEWLEKFPHGFKRDDRSTWTAEHLPYGVKGGLYNRYSVNHEAFVWKIRTEPGIIKAFEQIWGTDDLIVSFDGMNLSLPLNAKTGRTDLEQTAPWPHMDQDPRKVEEFQLYQGIANCSPNGPDDGGLVVLAGSHLLHSAHFASLGGFREEKALPPGENGYDFSAEDADWYRQNGCEEVKICCNPGDLILWDSRTIHWNQSPTGEHARFVIYVCYCPRSMMDDATFAKKLQAFKARKGTTHWPQLAVVPADRKNYHHALPRRPDDSVDPANRFRPFVEPEETPEVMRLVGVRG